MRLLHTPLFFADALVADGQADGCVAGAVHTTGDVLRAALWLVGPQEGVRTVSSSFYMVVPPFRGSSAGGADLHRLRGRALSHGDASSPTSPLPRPATAAASSATSRLWPFYHSARAAARRARRSILFVRRSTEVRARAPHLAVDGELQGDAALVSLVADTKGAG